ncbi:non-specific phospholipase C4-like [Panicum miliaceum]|uniref:Non-specific phospholipase C4-like n=1 Tax=Panicum miliaceum TaxID=4540 RepID=A0A3L6SE47_PANMI|nr:non-specific phospholipase C4-like [Panicum miliaceum]
MGGAIFGYDIGTALASNYCRFDSQLLTIFTSSLYIAGLLTAALLASWVTACRGHRPSLVLGGRQRVHGILGRALLGIGLGFVNQASTASALFVSPWIDPGTVVHRPSGPYPTSEFEHSSIPATVNKIFNLDDFLTKRDAWAGTFDSVLTRDTPRTDCLVTLPEPVKLRQTAAAEHAPLSEFQEELVQLAAVLNGDHTKDSYPHKLVEGMMVAEAAKYCVDAFRAFLDECDRCNKCGEDGSHIPTVKPSSAPGKNKSSFASKVLACLACGHPSPSSSS